MLRLKFKRAKYGNVPVTAFNISFRSKEETYHAMFLESERQAGRIKKWEYEKKQYKLIVRKHLICSILPDFEVTFPDGRVEIHEVKSSITMTPEWRIKRKLFEVLYPRFTYLVVL